MMKYFSEPYLFNAIIYFIDNEVIRIIRQVFTLEAYMTSIDKSNQNVFFRGDKDTESAGSRGPF